jgi:hypothetical protein
VFSIALRTILRRVLACPRDATSSRLSVGLRTLRPLSCKRICCSVVPKPACRRAIRVGLDVRSWLSPPVPRNTVERPRVGQESHLAHDIVDVLESKVHSTILGATSESPAGSSGSHNLLIGSLTFMFGRRSVTNRIRMLPSPIALPLQKAIASLRKRYWRESNIGTKCILAEFGLPLT